MTGQDRKVVLGFMNKHATLGLRESIACCINSNEHVHASVDEIKSLQQPSVQKALHYLIDTSASGGGSKKHTNYCEKLIEVSDCLNPVFDCAIPRIETYLDKAAKVAALKERAKSNKK